MARLSSILLAAITSLFSTVRAFDYFEIDGIVQAGQSTTVTVDLDQDEYYPYAAGYRIFLATTLPGWGTAPTCWLLNYSSIATTEVEVTIPASVAPDGTVLSLSLSLSEVAPDDGSFEFLFSNDFTLEGGTGAWSAMEVNSSGIGFPDDIPCTALSCARDCANEYYPDGTIPYDEYADISVNSTFQNWYTCLSDCPGSSLPPWDLTYNSDGGDTPPEVSTPQA